jgi:hypothetical protein
MMPAKCLSAGLLAIAMLSAPVTAQAMSVSPRHELVKSRVSVSTPGQWIDGRARLHAPFAGEITAKPQNAPGGVCDSGDDPMIC